MFFYYDLYVISSDTYMLHVCSKCYNVVHFVKCVRMLLGHRTPVVKPASHYAVFPLPREKKLVADTIYLFICCLSLLQKTLSQPTLYSVPSDNSLFTLLENLVRVAHILLQP